GMAEPSPEGAVVSSSPPPQAARVNTIKRANIKQNNLFITFSPFLFPFSVSLLGSSGILGVSPRKLRVLSGVSATLEAPEKSTRAGIQPQGIFPEFPHLWKLRRNQQELESSRRGFF